MKARKLLDEKEFDYDHFTRLTSTGIEADYNAIAQFAEEYHQEQVKKLNIDDVSKCPHCKSDDVSDIEGIMCCSGCDSTY